MWWILVVSDGELDDRSGRNLLSDRLPQAVLPMLKTARRHRLASATDLLSNLFM